MAKIDIKKKKHYETKNKISDRAYNGIIGGLVAYGFIVNLFMTMFLSDFIAQIPMAPFLIGYFVMAIVSIIIMKVSKNPIVSFIGYNMLVIPIGCVVAICVPTYALSSIYIACFITGIVTFCMMTAAMIYPTFFLKLGRVLFFSLLLTIIFELILLLCGVNLQIWDWIVSIIFCGYIGYDWAKINKEPYKTLDSAVDSAAELYLDIINLFIRILSIIGNSDND